MAKKHEEAKAYVMKQWEKQGFTVTQEFKLPKGDGNYLFYDICAVNGEEKYLIEVGQLNSLFEDREKIANAHGYQLKQWAMTHVKRIRGDLLIRLSWKGNDINEAIEQLLKDSHELLDWRIFGRVPPRIKSTVTTSNNSVTGQTNKIDECWKVLQPKIQAMIDISIEDAKRGN